MNSATNNLFYQEVVTKSLIKMMNNVRLVFPQGRLLSESEVELIY